MKALAIIIFYRIKLSLIDHIGFELEFDFLNFVFCLFQSPDLESKIDQFSSILFSSFLDCFHIRNISYRSIAITKKITPNDVLNKCSLIFSACVADPRPLAYKIFSNVLANLWILPRYIYLSSISCLFSPRLCCRLRQLHSTCAIRISTFVVKNDFIPMSDIL